MYGPSHAETCELFGWSPWSIPRAPPFSLLGGWCGQVAPCLLVVGQNILNFIHHSLLLYRLAKL